MLSFSLCTTTLILCSKLKILRHRVTIFTITWSNTNNMTILFFCFAMRLKHNKIIVRKHPGNFRGKNICSVLLRHLGTEFWIIIPMIPCESVIPTVYDFRYYFELTASWWKKKNSIFVKKIKNIRVMIFHLCSASFNSANLPCIKKLTPGKKTCYWDFTQPHV